MKQLSIFVSIFLLIGVLSCDHKKEEEFTLSEGLPSWIKQKVEELSARKSEPCKNIWVLIYEAEGKQYYNIDFAYSSCSNCNLFDNKGLSVSQTQMAKLSDLKVIDVKPACP